MADQLSRRGLLGIFAASSLTAQAGRGEVSSYPPTRFLDAATELELYRLTDPAHPSWAPPTGNRTIARRGHFLLFVSDRGNGKQVFRLDWKSGETRQVTQAAALDPESPGLLPDDRSFCYADGSVLRHVTLGNLRERDLDRTPAGWDRAPGLTLSIDGVTAAWIERKSNQSRLRSIAIAKGVPSTLLESRDALSDVQLRPARTQASYRVGGTVWLINLDGQQNRQLRLAQDGTVGQTQWSMTGRTLLYLQQPADPKQLTTLREHTPDSNLDQLVAKTSQFASFGVNADSSVFVGASRSLASPYVLLLLRVTKRELTLCEHRAKDSRGVMPAFAPDSQSIFFSGERQGSVGLFRMRVERFVEETGDEPAG